MARDGLASLPTSLHSGSAENKSAKFLHGSERYLVNFCCDHFVVQVFGSSDRHTVDLAPATCEGHPRSGWGPRCMGHAQNPYYIFLNFYVGRSVMFSALGVNGHCEESSLRPPTAQL